MIDNGGSVKMPKDFNFENNIRLRLREKNMDDIICYDTCIFSHPNKEYGKVVVADDCIFVFNESAKKFTLAAHYQDVVKIEIVNDLPKFIFGPMRNNCIHIEVILNKSVQKIKETSSNLQLPYEQTLRKSSSQDSIRQIPYESTDNKPNVKLSKTVSSTLNLYEVSPTSDSTIVNFYILNSQSCIFSFLKLAHTDYLIRETLFYSDTNRTTTNKSELPVSSVVIERVFDEIIKELVQSKSSPKKQRDLMLELIHAGLKYSLIRSKFWSKSELYNFVLEQFLDWVNILFAIDLSSKSTSKVSPLEHMNSCLDSINILLQLLGVFLAETDHLHSKYSQLRKQDGKRIKLLLQKLLMVICFLNKQDDDDTGDTENSEIDVAIDLNKYYLTINAVRVLYYLIRASKVPFIIDENTDSFTLRHVARIVESMSNYSDRDGVFNRFLNQALRMIFIWIFPDVFKIPVIPDVPPPGLDPQQIVMIFQLFSAIYSLIHCVPKFMDILRMEMKEEFEYFVVRELSFSEFYPLTGPTLKLLRLFQINILNDNEIFLG